MSSATVNPVVGSTPLIELTVKDEAGNLLDLTTATPTILLKSPIAAVAENNAEVNTDPTDGVIKYRCLTATLDIPGEWQVQAHAVFDDGLTYFSNIETFTVDPKLE